MSTTIIRYEVKPDQADENTRLVEEVFEQLNAERPEGVRYITFRMDDGVNFVHIVSYDDGASDALTSLAAFKAFQENAGERIATGPERGTAEIVGSYGFLTK